MRLNKQIIYVLHSSSQDIFPKELAAEFKKKEKKLPIPGPYTTIEADEATASSDFLKK